MTDGENVKVLRYPYLRVIIHDGNIENEKDECSSVRGGRNPDADWLCKPIGLGGLRVGSGFLHGWIAVFAMIGHLFDNSIAIYSGPNNGGWYDFGFLLGVGAFGGTAGAAAR